MSPPKHLGFPDGAILPFAAAAYPFTPNNTADAKSLAATLNGILSSNLQTILPKTYPIPVPGQKARRVLVPFSILFIAAPGGSDIYAGVNDDAMCYSASLLKVAVMYAAFELLAAANRVAATVTVPSGTNASDAQDLLLAALGAAFDKGLAAGPLAAKLNAATPGTPAYEDILEFQPGQTPQVKFQPTFASNMDLMIRLSDDPASVKCIDALGFTYINAALANGGFFNHAAGADHGIWISGDYGLKEVRQVPTVNDGLGKLVMNTANMLKMFALILEQTLIDATSSQAMASELVQAATGLVPWIVHDDDPNSTVPVTVPFVPFMSKPGFGPLGRASHFGENVYSECSALQWSASDADTINGLAAKKLSDKIIICWQNFFEERLKSFDKIRLVVESTIMQFAVA
jgi:hypothetical protein